MGFSRDSTANLLIGFTMPCIDAIVTNHLEVFFRYVTYESFDELEGRNRLNDIFVVFVAIVMEGDEFTIIFINA